MCSSSKYSVLAPNPPPRPFAKTSRPSPHFCCFFTRPKMLPLPSYSKFMASVPSSSKSLSPFLRSLPCTHQSPCSFHPLPNLSFLPLRPLSCTPKSLNASFLPHSFSPLNLPTSPHPQIRRHRFPAPILFQIPACHLHISPHLPAAPWPRTWISSFT